MDSQILFFLFGFTLAIFIYARSVSAVNRKLEWEVSKKEYSRQKRLAQMSGRDFEIIDEFEDDNEDLQSL